MNMSVSLLRLPQVLERVGLRRSAWYALVADGKAPQAIKIGTRAVCWASDSIDRWIADKIASSIAQDASLEKDRPPAAGEAKAARPRGADGKARSIGSSK